MICGLCLVFIFWLCFLFSFMKLIQIKPCWMGCDSVPPESACSRQTRSAAVWWAWSAATRSRRRRGPPPSRPPRSCWWPPRWAEGGRWPPSSAGAASPPCCSCACRVTTMWQHQKPPVLNWDQYFWLAQCFSCWVPVEQLHVENYIQKKIVQNTRKLIFSPVFTVCKNVSVSPMLKHAWRETINKNWPKCK